MDETTAGRDRLLLAAFLAFVAVAVYANSFPGTFIQDDLPIAWGNPLVRNFDLVGILTSDYWGEGLNSGLYRPLTIASFALNRLVLGESPWGFHLVNVLLHAGVVVAIWRLLIQWRFKGGVAILAALLFAVHPIHTEVVDIVVGRSELLAALFLLMAFIYATKEGKCSWFVVGFYAAALFSKEHAITFLALLPLADAFFSGNLTVFRRRIPLYCALLAISIIWLAIRAYIHYGIPPLVSSPYISPLHDLSTQSRVLSGLQYQALYLWKLAVPINLQTAYSSVNLPAVIATVYYLRGMLVISVTIIAATSLYWGVTRQKVFAFLALLYLIAFSPTSNVFIPIGVTVAERLAYFPSIWFCVMVAYLCGLGAERGGRWRIIVQTSSVGCVLLLALLCQHRNRFYASEVQLWSAEVRQNERDPLAWLNFAESLAKSRRGAEAEKAYARVFELAGDFQPAMRSRVMFLVNNGRFKEALVQAEHTLDISRQINDSIGIAEDTLDLVEIYLGLQEPETALRHLNEIGYSPYGKDRLLEMRGQALSMMGRDSEAVVVLSKVKKPLLNSRYRFYYGISLYRLGRLPEARHELEDDVRENDKADGWNLFGVVCAQLGDGKVAEAALDRAVELAPDKPGYRENLENVRRSRKD